MAIDIHATTPPEGGQKGNMDTTGKKYSIVAQVINLLCRRLTAGGAPIFNRLTIQRAEPVTITNKYYQTNPFVILGKPPQMNRLRKISALPVTENEPILTHSNPRSNPTDLD
jgi:hypothetical protein